MNISFLVPFFSLFLVYGGLNYYLGLRSWQYFFNYIFKYTGNIRPLLYWIVFWFVSFSYILARAGKVFLSQGIRHVLTIIGSYWLAVMFYLFLIWTLLDIFKLLIKLLSFIPPFYPYIRKLQEVSKPNFLAGGFIMLLIAAIFVYGTWNARHPVVTRYDIHIPKTVNGVEGIHAVMVSDLHLGEINGVEAVEKMVNMIEKLNPDIIFLAGDVIDEDTDPFIKQNMAAALLRLRAKYGIYGVLGNHEYIGGMTDKAAAVLESTGIKVLRDSYVKIGENIVIAGRDDMSHSYLSQKQRKTLNSMLEGVDKSLPIILLNHQPRELEEAGSAGVDLQLSGHTHRGQLFPNHLITEKIYEDDWGYLKKGNLQLIVSSGFGTWGPPIRTGNRPEIVDIHISFNRNI